MNEQTQALMELLRACFEAIETGWVLAEDDGSIFRALEACRQWLSGRHEGQSVSVQVSLARLPKAEDNAPTVQLLYSLSGRDDPETQETGCEVSPHPGLAWIQALEQEQKERSERLSAAFQALKDLASLPLGVELPGSGEH